MTFESLGLQAPILRALADAGYDAPTDVQRAALPPALDGRDINIASSTGSGKTAAYLLPALERMLAKAAEPSRGGPRVLVLAPTRELALQVAQAAATYGRHLPGLRVATVVGGVPYGAQLKALRGRLDILVST